MNSRIFLLSACAAISAVASAIEIDGIAAMVGEKAILRSEVRGEMRRAGVVDELRFAEFRNELIDRLLILNAAGESKMSMQEWVVEDRIRTIIEKSFGGDRNKLIEVLSREKISYSDWRRRIKEDLIINAMRWNSVNKYVRASPAAMKAEYDAHPERYGAKPRVSVSVILLKPDQQGNREAVEAMVRTNSFAAAAKEWSADSHAAQGGAWKDVDPKEAFNPAVCEEISKMPVGTVSKWIELDGWSFLLKKDDETEARPRSFAEAYEDIENRVRDDEARRLMKEWIGRLRADAYIKIYDEE